MLAFIPTKLMFHGKLYTAKEETDNKPPVFKLWTENIFHQDGSADVCGHSLERVDDSSGMKVSDLDSKQNPTIAS